MTIAYAEDTRTAPEAPFVEGEDRAPKFLNVRIIACGEETFVAPYRSSNILPANYSLVASEPGLGHIFNVRTATTSLRDFVYPKVKLETFQTCPRFFKVDFSNLSQFFFVPAQWENSTAIETPSRAVTQSMAAFNFAEKNGLLESLSLLKNIITGVLGTALKALRIDLDDDSEAGAYPTVRFEMHVQGTVEQASHWDDTIQRKIVENVPAPHQMFFSLDYQFGTDAD